MFKILTSGIVVVSIFSALATAADKNSALFKNAEKGNLKSLNQAFILHAKSDGADAEDIDVTIGKSIRNNPRNFLIALKKNRKIVPRLDAVLGGLGYDYVDDFIKQKTELVNRLKAIQSIKDKPLEDVRSECESILKRQIKERS